MAIYVSELFKMVKNDPDSGICYLVSTTKDELLNEIKRIKIPEKNLRKDKNGILHVLLTKRQRRRVVDRGAHEISLEKLISKKKDWAE